MSVLHCELRYEIDRSGSPDRDGDRHIDIASDRIRVRADRMSTLDEPFSGPLVDASHGHRKRGGQLKASCLFRLRSVLATTSISSSAHAVCCPLV